MNVEINNDKEIIKLMKEFIENHETFSQMGKYRLISCIYNYMQYIQNNKKIVQSPVYDLVGWCVDGEKHVFYPENNGHIVCLSCLIAFSDSEKLALIQYPALD